jgi:hypothetical protein
MVMTHMAWTNTMAAMLLEDNCQLAGREMTHSTPHGLFIIDFLIIFNYLFN